MSTRTESAELVTRILGEMADMDPSERLDALLTAYAAFAAVQGYTPDQMAMIAKRCGELAIEYAESQGLQFVSRENVGKA